MLRCVTRLIMTMLFAVPALLGSAAAAAAEDRALKLYFTHTGEKATITFKRNGRFDPKGMEKINRLLRDWRRNEPARMDPRLLDLVWEVYDRSGASDYIHIVSAYRSPATNNMLRSRSRSTGVAKNSQHTLGKAMDFFIPGVKLSTLRAVAMQMQGGGVGYYPTSGSPFVHLDVGNVRAWPRMSRKELARIFPNGRTMHLAADGSSLPGYAPGCRGPPQTRRFRHCRQRAPRHGRKNACDGAGPGEQQRWSGHGALFRAAQQSFGCSCHADGPRWPG